MFAGHTLSVPLQVRRNRTTSNLKIMKNEARAMLNKESVALVAIYIKGDGKIRS